MRSSVIVCLAAVAAACWAVGATAFVVTECGTVELGSACPPSGMIFLQASYRSPNSTQRKLVAYQDEIVVGVGATGGGDKFELVNVGGAACPHFGRNCSSDFSTAGCVGICDAVECRTGFSRNTAPGEELRTTWFLHVRAGVDDCSATVGLEGKLLTAETDDELVCSVHTVQVDQADDCGSKARRA